MTGIQSSGGSSPFTVVFFPLAVVLALAFGLPYFMWNRARSAVSP